MKESRDKQIERLQGNDKGFYALSGDDRRFLGSLDCHKEMVVRCRGEWVTPMPGSFVSDSIYRIHRDYKPQLVTPSEIKFAVQSDGVVVGLYYNDDKQVLGYDRSGVYEVNLPREYACSPKECLPLTSCTYGDLEPGEFCSVKEVPSIEDIRLVLPEKKGEAKQAVIFVDEDVRIYSGRPHSVWKVGK